MKHCSYILLVLFFGLLNISCDNLLKPKRVVSEDDSLLASIEGRELYLSDIADMISAKDANDSLSQINGLIESWLKRNVILNEAEEKFPDNVDIDKLVEDYKSSLLLHNYRQVLIEKELDTTITSLEEEEYYKQNKDQYLLQDPVCRGRIAQVSEDAPKMEKFYKNWKKNDSIEIIKYLEGRSLFRMEDVDTWYSVNQFMAMLPENEFDAKDFTKSGDLQKHIDDSEYFIKIIELKSKNEVAPLAYVSDNIRKVIIHKRKQQILDNIEKTLYNSYLNANRIKVFDK